MLGKRGRPVIAKLREITGDTTKHMFSDLTSPRGPLEYKIRSPGGLKTCDASITGVGLGIVAALGKMSNGGEKPVVARSDPISIDTYKNGPSNKFRGGLQADFDMDDEDFTCVTTHGTNNESYTRVYCEDRPVFDSRNFRFGIFMESSVPKDIKENNGPAFPTMSFLSSCHLCRKGLDGKDIYMYRSEKAFCSTDCRYRQIAMDEHKEKCGSETPRTADLSVSPYTGSQLFSTGILAI